MKKDSRKLGLGVLAGGMAAGTVDFIVATAAQVGRGRAPLDGWRFVASGLVGKAALSEAWWTGPTGIVVHFGLTTIMAGLFVLAARRSPMLLKSLWLSGLAYGALLFVAMNYVIVPHSAVPRWATPVGFWGNLNGAITHSLFVALPIVSAAQYFLGAGRKIEFFKPDSTTRLARGAWRRDSDQAA